MNGKWECYICGYEDKFKNEPSGYLGNYHPLCLNCADDIYFDEDNEDRFRLTYHSEFGELLFFENKLIQVQNFKLN